MMMGWEITVSATRLVASLIIALVTGIALSAFLAAIGHAHGYNPEAIFNLAGLSITGYMIAWFWQRHRALAR
ncbi:hypothetical protein [Candidatus Amarolinea dominans]|uniref:hypothetical protein n=1 Tax=Candidatus Amarolinea dominans TaxID=3140696 RepID=UPI001D41342A|nr:hypothetical protein [Anaerolineae bacterium]MBK9092230.1 hypothetical protein [Anaerolineae bacterium]